LFIPAFQSRFDRVDSDSNAIRVELAMLKWMFGGAGFGVLLLVLRFFWPGQGARCSFPGSA
jgi:hypothetical protein